MRHANLFIKGAVEGTSMRSCRLCAVEGSALQIIQAWRREKFIVDQEWPQNTANTAPWCPAAVTTATAPTAAPAASSSARLSELVEGEEEEDDDNQLLLMCV